MAATTASGRCVKVAQPSPYNPGSFVSILTTTRRIPSGAVQITRTSRILIGELVSQAGGRIGAGVFSTDIDLLPVEKRRARRSAPFASFQVR